MVSITDSPTQIQGIGPGKSPAVDEFHVAEDYNTTEGQAEDHEDEEAMRRRLEEWRAMAANLQGGFTQMPDAVRKDPTLSSNAKLVYEHLLGYMWDKEWCWPSQKRIAAEIGISRRTVIRVCKELSNRLYIEKWRRGLGRTNVYFVNPLTFVISTGIALTQINLHPFTDVAATSSIAALYNTTFYAIDPIPNITKPSKTNNQTNDIEQAAAERVKEVNTAKTNQKPSAQAAAIAAVTGIPVAQLAELGIAQEPRRRPIPSFITEKITRYTKEIGDAAKSTKSNITRAAKLYYFGVDYIKEAQEDPQTWFTDQIYEAKQAAYAVNCIQYRNANNSPNRIPVFFTCLENRFELSDDELLYIRSELPLMYPEDRE